MNAERTTARGTGFSAAALTLLLMVGAPGATVPGQAQANWPFQLEWKHDGARVDYFRLCVNGRCEPVSAAPRGNGVWRARLPLLPEGEHRLIVEACGFGECLPGAPDLMIRVLEPNGRRPPIDVLSGPRVGVGNR